MFVSYKEGFEWIYTCPVGSIHHLIGSWPVAASNLLRGKNGTTTIERNNIIQVARIMWKCSRSHSESGRTVWSGLSLPLPLPLSKRALWRIFGSAMYQSHFNRNEWISPIWHFFFSKVSLYYFHSCLLDLSYFFQAFVPLSVSNIHVCMDKHYFFKKKKTNSISLRTFSAVFQWHTDMLFYIKR